MSKSEEKESDAKNEEQSAKQTANGHFPTKILWLVLIFGAGWWLYKNPQIAGQGKAWVQEVFEQPEKQTENLRQVSDIDVNVENLQKQIVMLQTELFNLKNSMPAPQEPIDTQKLDELYNKFDTIEKTNMNIIDSKADASAVLGMMSRLDVLEKKVGLISKTTDESALILTAAMLVKDAAGRGGSFVYEAEVLRQLAQNNPQLEDSLSVIEKAAQDGVVTNARLINDFDDIYKTLLKKQKEAAAQTWKDRVLAKLSDFVKVRKVNEAEKEEIKILQNLKNIRSFVQEENFSRAAEELSLPENAVLAEDAGLQKWLGLVSSKLDFERAVSKISTYSLAVMKVNAIKKEAME